MAIGHANKWIAFISELQAHIVGRNQKLITWHLLNNKIASQSLTQNRQFRLCPRSGALNINAYIRASWQLYAQLKAKNSIIACRLQIHRTIKHQCGIGMGDNRGNFTHSGAVSHLENRTAEVSIVSNSRETTIGIRDFKSFRANAALVNSARCQLGSKPCKLNRQLQFAIAKKLSCTSEIEREINW